MMTVRSRLQGGGVILAVVSAFSGSAVVHAQAAVAPVVAPTTSPSVTDQGAGSEIVVTGTRIKRLNNESNSPLTVVDAAEIKYQGATTVDQFLNRLPQFTADENENASNGADGTAKINLRHLGSDRALILINGRRMLPQQAIDTNFVPSSLIQRVDIVSGGASAVYGSDALSGVVNFILRDNLDGFRFDGQASVFQHTNDLGHVRDLVRKAGYQNSPSNVIDGGKQDMNLAYGKNFAGGRGNITVFGGYHHVNPVTQDTRDFSSCALDPLSDSLHPINNGTDLQCGGSSNNQYGQFTLLTGPGKGLTLNNTKDGSKTWAKYDSSFLYNTSPANYIQRSDSRYNAGAFVKFKFSPLAEIYGNFLYMNDHTFSQAAPSAFFSGTTFQINCDNPLMSASQAQTLCGPAVGTSTNENVFIGYRLTGPGSSPRRDDLRHTDYRYTVGLRGDFAKGFSYDLNYLRSLSRLNETYMNNVDNVKGQRALQVVNVNGKPTCKSVIDGSDPSCIPADVFGYNALSPDSYQYLYSPSSTFGRNTQTIFSGTVNGQLGEYGIQSPWANEGVGISLGAEHRKETLLFLADAVAQQNGTLNSDGTISVNEGYGEINIPILQNLPFAHELSIDGGVRYSSYHNSQGSTGFQSDFNVWTYKAELSYAPIRDVRLRASYNRAIRAPNISELFQAVGLGNVAATDPCSNFGGKPSASEEACALTGVTPEQYGTIPECPSQTCVQQFGGNRNLKPEKGDTITIGAVITPQMLRNFSLSVDYFHIKIKHYIDSIDPSLTISQCFETGDPYYCGLFHRDPSNGVLFGTNGYVVGTTLNTGYLQTSGLDVTANYWVDLNKFGKLNFDLVGSYLLDLKTQPLPGLGTYSCKGRYGYACGEPAPTWRHQLRTTWTIPGSKSTVSLAWRYFGSTKLPGSDLGANIPFNQRIKAYNYFDLATTADVHGLTLRAGVNNLFDKSPPVIDEGILSTFGNGNTYPGVYDPLGRTIFVGATVEF
jgi:outer membrane receptor protein involved in Fe transport